MKYPGFIGGSYRPANRAVDSEQTINWYVERMESQGAKSQSVLNPTPGFQRFCTVDRFPGRGIFAQNDRVFTIADTVIYEIFANKTYAARAAGLVNDGLPALIVSSGEVGDELAIQSGGRVYVYDLLANTLTQVLNPGNYVAYLDGRFLALDYSSNQLRISNDVDGTIWDGTQFRSRAAAGDTWKAMAVAHRNLWIFGSQSSEVWYNAGTAPFPFAPIGGASINYGIRAPYSLVVVDNAPMWLGASEHGAGMVLRGTGESSAARISDHALEFALQTYSTIDDAIGWGYQESGHTFYMLTFPTADVTWSLDVATGQWHQRGSRNLQGLIERMRAQFHCFAFGKHLVQDRITGDVHEMSSNFSTDVDGTGVRRVRRAPILHNEGGRIFYNSFELDLEVGIGLTAPVQGWDPQVMLRVSADGGQTFGNERRAKAGPKGAYKQRALWYRLGSARQAVFEVSTSDPVPFKLVDAYIDVEATDA